MARIMVLDEATANQIAAGEVVERPASVVKELLENSLDAGARRITIEIAGGGRELVRVTDDGSGMDAADAQLCLQRHATSKIRTAGDLTAVRSFGFRGEALPSIASVAKVELATRTAAALAGTHVVVHGGTVVSVAESGCPVGTRVEVRDLFFNTPARLRHLKTLATEVGRCGDVATRLALAHPDVSIKFRSSLTEVFVSPGRGGLMGAAAAVLGVDVARQLLPVSYQGRACSVQGLVGRPAAARSSRAHQYLTANGRPVHALALRYALEEAFGNVIPLGRYPVVILDVQVPPDEIDVNVHPQKLEARFVREREIRSDIYRGVQAALAALLLVPGAEVAATTSPAAGVESAHMPGWAREAAGSYQPPLQATLGAAAGPPFPAASPGFPDHPLPGTPWAPDRGGIGPGAANAAWTPPRPGEALPTDPGDLLRSLRPLGQVRQSYIACDGPGGLYLVDQHAAHERVFFEHLLRAAEDHVAPVQPLLFPATVELTGTQVGLWQGAAELFRECGIHAEPFGGRTLLVQAIPAGISERWAARLVRDFLDRLLADQFDAGGPMDRRRRALAALAACKAAIKANDPLQPTEIDALLSDLAGCAQPGQCPHGRPTVILVAMPELEKRFGRK